MQMIECVLKIDASLIEMSDNLTKAEFSQGEAFSYITKQGGIVALRHVSTGVAYLTLKETFEETFSWTIHKETPQ
jgi:hypothetical protein